MYFEIRDWTVVKNSRIIAGFLTPCCEGGTPATASNSIQPGEMEESSESCLNAVQKIDPSDKQTPTFEYCKKEELEEFPPHWCRKGGASLEVQRTAKYMLFCKPLGSQPSYIYSSPDGNETKQDYFSKYEMFIHLLLYQFKGFNLIYKFRVFRITASSDDPFYVTSPRVWPEVMSDRPFSTEAPKSVTSLSLHFQAQSGRRLSAVFRSGGLWLWGSMADGWFLVIFRGLTILCMEDVLAPGSVGGCVGRLCGCLRTARMWRALFMVQCSAGSMLQVRIIILTLASLALSLSLSLYLSIYLSISLSAPPPLPSVRGVPQSTVLQ